MYLKILLALGRKLHIFSYLFCLSIFLKVCTASTIYKINAQPTAETAKQKQPNIEWVPILERNKSDLTTIVLDVFRQNDKVTTEKVDRISKMLNESIEAQEKELAEGNRKLSDLTTPDTYDNSSNAPLSSSCVIILLILLLFNIIY
ncbi:hypothetical protein Ddc_05736 [Ditylenchus destructor]|nr:hypothetical protein Ddc_05736 [Ditylenchus destructor]